MFPSHGSFLFSYDQYIIISEVKGKHDTTLRFLFTF